MRKFKDRFSAWCAHHFNFVLISLATWPPVEVTITLLTRPPGRTWYVTSIPELVFAAALTVWTCWCVLTMLMWFFAMGHFGSMCVKCIEKLPPDAAVRAQKWHPLFAFQHTLDDIPRFLMRVTRNSQKLSWLLLLCVFFSPLIIAVVLSAVVPDVWRGPVISLGAALLAFLGGVPFKLHTAFAPWCEYCQDDGWEDEGPEEPSPDLPPLPFISKTI